MIEIRHLSHTLGQNTILEEVNLTIPDSTVMGLVGINGAGKTTLLRLMSGVYLPDKGRIFYDGDREPCDEKTRQDIFFLPDDPYYTMNATGKSMRETYSLFYPRFDNSVYYHFLEEYGLDEKKPLRSFSKGMRRQLYIAIALAAKPRFLLLDEAFDGLDPLARKSFREAINKQVDEEGTTVIISSHSLRELEDFCDMYALIDNKTVSSSGDIAERVSRLCKFQLAFLGDIPEGALRALPSVSIDIQGRFVKIIMEGERDKCEALLKALEPAVIDEMPMNFEEAFIHEVDKKGGLK